MVYEDKKKNDQIAERYFFPVRCPLSFVLGLVLVHRSLFIVHRSFQVWFRVSSIELREKVPKIAKNRAIFAYFCVFLH